MTAVVAVGGGHGLAATIRAVGTYASPVTAIVSTADDGGSTGRLRAELDLPALGDLRRCLLSMAEIPAAWRELFEHRFDRGALAGHAVGNLLLAGLVEVSGDLVAACDAAAEMLGIEQGRGRVVPATTDLVTLLADTAEGPVEGQAAIQCMTGVERVRIDPTDAAACDVALDALGAADQVVLGPGSLYTSVLAALAVPGLAKAVTASPARVVFVANLRADEPETKGYDVADHVAALRQHGVEPDVVVCQQGGLEIGDLSGVEVVAADVDRPHGLAHDPALLGQVLAGLAR